MEYIGNSTPFLPLTRDLRLIPSRLVLLEISARQIDADQDLRLMIHPGDMSYADSNATRWDRYDTLMEPLSSRLQWMVVPGNHEIESDAITGANFVPYKARFNMPRIKPPVNKPTPSQKGCLHVWPPIPTSRPDCTPSI